MNWRLRKDERLSTGLMFLFITVMNVLAVYKYQDVMMNTHRWFRWKFFKVYELSGFDPINYAVTSAWEPGYDVYRHPLLSFLMYPFYWVNKGLMELTGYNCSQWVLLPVVVFSATLSYVLLRRILTDILRLASWDATLLSVLTWGYAYMMLCSVVPDHFIFSLPCLLLALYAFHSSLFTHRSPLFIFLFILTAGVTLTNGVKVWLCSLFSVRTWKMQLLFLMAAALLLGVSHWQYKQLVEPVQQVRKAEQKRVEEKRSKKPGYKPKKYVSRNGKPLANLPFIQWTDVTTPRDTTLVENFFGESLQFHQSYFVQDIWKKRPVFVQYDWWLNYVIELFMVVLIVAGAWLNRHSRFLWLCLSWLAVDVGLHLILGFTINEVYIMSPHWLFLLTICMAGLYQRVPVKVLRPLFLSLAVWLYLYNGYQLVGYLLTPVSR
ncbi:MAG: hypothetical protein IJS97_09610 [Prevotella sp.]|nr:hypothetical protein [Prevotella sp.]